MARNMLEPAGAIVAGGPRPVLLPVPVEYAVAVDRYLEQAVLGASSRRVYKISLAGWAWPLAGRPLPQGQGRRGAAPPVIPLALLDDHVARDRLAEALADRARRAGARTVGRELSALRSAVAWWLEAGWIARDPTAGLRAHGERSPVTAPLTARQLAALFTMPAPLREQAFWHLLHDTGVPAQVALAMDAGDVGPGGRPRGIATARLGLPGWSERTSDLIAWLLSGRSAGPVFLTNRRAAGSPSGPDVCPLTRRARMSYRRAAEIFTTTTMPLDPAGRGWTLHQLRRPRGG